ncbi:MAG: hypothetical protein ACW98A_07415 [Candidatus Hodarchaeales archaeon]|jgi:hypothetical protein
MTQDQKKLDEEKLFTPTDQPDIPYSIRDTFSFAQNEIDAIHSEVKAGLRKLGREAKYLWRGMDLVLLFLLLGIIIVALFLISVIIIPLLLTFFPESVFEQAFLFNDSGSLKLNSLSQSMLDLWLNDTTLRIGVGGAGALGIAFRLLMKRDVEKFRDKVKSRDNVTFVFGSTIYAERFCHQMVFEHGYEEYIALISDQEYLWVQNIAGLLDTYTMKNLNEFEKENFYKMIEFKNAKRIMLLSDNVERNQAILTNIRGVRPDVPIFILSQYTPAFLESKLVEDENIHVIDDLDETNRGLVTSLSLDIVYPDCAEINVPRRYVGRSAEYITKDTPEVEVLAIRRPDIDVEGGSWKIVMPNEKLQRTDRILCYFTHDFFMKKLNRIATELPVHPLVDLGYLNIDGDKNKITDLPEHSLFLEPMGSRRSWRRVFLTLFGILSLLFSVILGRGQISSLNDFFNNYNIIISWDVFFFIGGFLLLLITYLYKPISEKGIKIISKTEDTYLIKTKSISIFGKDTVYELKKIFDIYCEEDRISKDRKYYFQLKDGELLPFITLLKDKQDKKTYELVRNRFEKRLQKYSSKNINYIEDLRQVKEIREDFHQEPAIDDQNNDEITNEGGEQ